VAKKNKKLKKLKKQLRAMNAGMPAGSGGLMAGLGRLLPSRRSDQFLLGLALGAAGAYVLSDEALRGRIIKSWMKLYAGMASGVEEMKEQMEDIKAEMAAEQAI
jgi:hypothetical protein